MAEQFACFFSTILEFETGEFGAEIFSKAGVISGSGDPKSGTHGVVIDNTKDFVGDDALILAGAPTLAYIVADETIIADLALDAKYHLNWSTYIDPEAIATSNEPSANNTASELSDLQTYLSNVTGFNITKIRNYLTNKFDMTVTEIVTWSTERARIKTVKQFMILFSDYASAKAELDE